MLYRRHGRSPFFEVPDIWLIRSDHYEHQFTRPIVAFECDNYTTLLSTKSGDPSLLVTSRGNGAILKVSVTDATVVSETNELYFWYDHPDGTFWRSNYYRKTVSCYTEDFEIVEQRNAFTKFHPMDVAFLNGVMIVIEDKNRYGGENEQLSFYEAGSQEPSRSIQLSTNDSKHLRVCPWRNEIYVSFKDQDL